MTLKAYERGRTLIIDLGDEGDEDFLRITVQPINARLGLVLQALHAGIQFGQSGTLEADATNMGRIAVGTENWDIIDGPESTLRWAEANAVINAAFFWNVQGGGIDLVNTFLNPELGGHPKALSTLMQRNGLLPAFEQLTTLLDSVADAEIQSPAGTNDTSTRAGSKT